MLVLLQMFVRELRKLMEITVSRAKIIFRQQRREYKKRKDFFSSIQVGVFIQFPVLLPASQYHLNHCTRLSLTALYQIYQKNNLEQRQSLLMQK